MSENFPTPVVNPVVTGRIIPRTAVALTALEVCDCLRAHLRELCEELKLGEEQVGAVMELAEKGLGASTRLTSAHLTYPSISWSISVVLGEEGEVDCGWVIALTPTSILTRVPSRFTPSMKVEGVQPVDMVPDNLRARWGLKIMMHVQGSDGKVERVEVPNMPLQSPRTARKVDLDSTRPFVEEMVMVKEEPPTPLAIPDNELLADPVVVEVREEAEKVVLPKMRGRVKK